MHALNPITLEGRGNLISEFQASQGHIVRPCLKKKQKQLKEYKVGFKNSYNLEAFKDLFLLPRQKVYFQVLQSVQTDYQIVHTLVSETLCVKDNTIKKVYFIRNY